MLLSNALLIVHYLAQPFHKPVENRAESASLLALFVLAVILSAGTIPLSTGAEVAVSIIILSGVFAFVGLFITQAVLNVQEQRTFRRAQGWRRTRYS